MYSTCLFCHRPLQSNEVIEHFPVGRRLAYDGAKGRLWVVCRRCERWNLTPLEERWEAIEECERLFRGTRLRMSTDNVGLAKIKEGLELVRIGQPLRPEFAAWRYGDQFGRRRKRAILWGAVGLTATGALAAGAVAAGVSVAAVAQVPNLVLNARTRVQIKTREGRVLKVRNVELRKARFLVEPERDGWALSVKHSKGAEIFEGEEAVRVTGLLLPKMNQLAGSKKAVEGAVGQIAEAGDPETYLETTLRGLRQPSGQRWEGPILKGQPGTIRNLPKPTKLALEMAVHEERERRALAGELAMLELAWREAEEIAGIADNLLVPKETEAFIERHRG